MGAERGWRWSLGVGMNPPSGSAEPEATGSQFEAFDVPPGAWYPIWRLGRWPGPPRRMRVHEDHGMATKVLPNPHKPGSNAKRTEKPDTLESRYAEVAERIAAAAAKSR